MIPGCVNLQCTATLDFEHNGAPLAHPLAVNELEPGLRQPWVVADQPLIDDHVVRVEPSQRTMPQGALQCRGL